MISENQEQEWFESIVELIHHYMETNPTAPSEPEFHKTLEEALSEMMEQMLEDLKPKEYQVNQFFNQDNDKQDADMFESLEDVMEHALEYYFQTFMPCRSHSDTKILFDKTPDQLNLIEERIHYLLNKPQPKQRTDEWYETRYNLITASNAYKAFESQAMKNQLIYEKCQPIQQGKMAMGMTNVNTAFHWGQKYEPVAVMFYEHWYETQVGEFGCIQHDTYPFLGASPDGINVDPTSPRYGRLLEIKNIVNREMDGIPKKEYWIQMQLQMETCDLNECDFLEMRFVEYKDDEYQEEINTVFGLKRQFTYYYSAEKKFMMDGQSFNKTANDGFKGIIMYFANEQGNPFYQYMPLGINTYEQYVAWERDTLKQMEHENKTWIQNLFWKLEEFSCVLVERNRLWFQQNIGELEALWKIVQEERITGSEHRAPNKRDSRTPASTGSSSTDLVMNHCYLRVNKLSEAHQEPDT